jgi:low affinity Fe/Cu permease
MEKRVIMDSIKRKLDHFSQAMWAILKAAKRFVRSKIVKLSRLGGSLGAFTVSLTVVLVWAITGPYFNFSDTWQLVINTGTTIVTFLMAFSIQYSQNKDTKQITMILKSLMKQNEALREQLAAIELEMEEDD